MTLNKKIPYQGFDFNVKVERAENGYTITINDLGQTSFYDKFNSTNEELVNTVNLAIDTAKKFADEKIRSIRKMTYTDAEIRLLDEGFTD